MRDDLIEVEASSAPSTSGHPIERYQIDSVLDHQPLTIDWVPKKGWSVGVTIACIFGLTSFLLAGHYFHVLFPAAGQGVENQAGLIAKLGAQTTLWSLAVAGSFSQMFLLTLGIASLVLVYQIYLLRKHRSDDYLGSYQVWLWVLPAVGFYALANVASLQALVQLLTDDLALLQSPLLGSMVYFLFPSLIIATCATRCFFEIKESTVATVFLMFAAVLGVLSLGLAARRPLGFADVPAIANLPNDLPLALWFVASAAFTSCLLTYLSYVHKDVMGLIQHTALDTTQRAAKSRKQNRPAADAASHQEMTPAMKSEEVLDLDEKPSTIAGPKSSPTRENEFYDNDIDSDFDQADASKIRPLRTRRKSA